MIPPTAQLAELSLVDVLVFNSLGLSIFMIPPTAQLAELSLTEQGILLLYYYLS
jgi:hypothetical protein